MTVVRLQLMRTDRTKKKRKAMVDDKVVEIKCRGYKSLVSSHLKQYLVTVTAVLVSSFSAS